MPSEMLVVRHCALIPAANLLDAKCEVLAGSAARAKAQTCQCMWPFVSINSRLLYDYILFVV
jgi:hypothetical protein